MPYALQELEVVIGDAHISFTTTKIGSLLDCKNSKYESLGIVTFDTTLRHVLRRTLSARKDLGR